MKPVGLVDPRTGRRPFAVVQLRKEDEAATAYNIVGFQTRMTWGEQARVFALHPRSREAEFLRFGAVHRNTFLNAPRAARPDVCAERRARACTSPGRSSASRATSRAAAGGWLVAHFIAERLSGREPLLPPPSTAHGGLIVHAQRNPDDYQPSNITFSHLPPWQGPRLKKRARYAAMAERALADLQTWLDGPPRQRWNPSIPSHCATEDGVSLRE